ncbi:hypothetical protein M5689_010963 [Euphorbia peplus]|nr:hypothetical protein M5689_010963 [Euphorbia peplus]
MADFQEVMEECGSNDIGYMGEEYTWFNRRQGEGAIWERLDRVVAQDAWLNLYPTTQVHTLLRVDSDHHPIFITTESIQSESRRRKHFRFENMWARHHQCHETVAASWGSAQAVPVQGKISMVSRSLSRWDREVFGHVTTQVQTLSKQLEEVQSLKDGNCKEEETSVAKKLNEMLDREEVMWKQRAKSEWLESGDRNIAFFHAKAKTRRQTNQIQRLQTDEGKLG